MDTLTWVTVIAIVSIFTLGWWKRISYVQALIFGNLAIFFITLLDGQIGNDAVLTELGFRPLYLQNGESLYTVITYMFLHGSVLHILFNMLFLFLIGMQLEYRIGKFRVAGIYYVTGIVAVMTEALVLGLDSTALVIGASGAIAGVMGAMFVLYPKDRIPMFLGPIFLPSIAVFWSVGVWLVMQLVLDLTTPSGQGGVAYAAHLGGFLAGMIIAVALPKVRPLTSKGEDTSSLETLATTPELKEELLRIQGETVPDVRKAWTEHFVSQAKCPRCGGPLQLKGNTIMSPCGFELKVR